MHFGAAELFVIGLLARSHLHEWRPREIDLSLLFDHHDVIAHAGHVRAPRRRASKDETDRRNLVFGALREMTETRATRNENLILLW